MKKVSFTLYFFISVLLLFGQSTDFDSKSTPTPVDKIVNTLPPDYPVRTMAEWEEVETLLISWHNEPVLQTQIIGYAVNECNVMIIAKSTQEKETIINTLTTAGVSLDNVDFLIKNFNNIWIRDYGPWSIYANEVGELALTDWIYDRPLRMLDDGLPEDIATELNLPFYEAIENPYNWIHAGGNVLRDGMGTGFSSDLVFIDNPKKDQQDLDEITASFLGFDRYFILPHLPYDNIHHLDMHMRLIDEETIIIGQYPEGVADGPQIEKNIDFIKNNYRTPFGNPYTIIRTVMPPDAAGNYPDEGGDYRTYTNAIFINKTILVPIYDETTDEEALDVYRKNLPGYNVVGIDCNHIIPKVGAIHCITKLIGVESPLWIAHPKLRNTFKTTTDYLVEAIIKHESGINEAHLFYRKLGADIYTSLPMYFNFNIEKWQATIPSQSEGTTIEYYIEAKANSGKIQRRPIVAPEGFFRFEILAAQAKPKADFYKKETNICEGTIVRYINNSSDDVIARNWSFDGGSPEFSLDENPEIFYNTAGTFDAQLIVENTTGQDTFLWENAVRVAAIASAVKPFEEDFSDGGNIAWKNKNPDSDPHLWTILEDGNCTGNSFLRMNNFNAEAIYTRDYYSIRIDLRDFTDAQLSFDVAYAQRANELKRIDELRVNIIRCDEQKTVVYNNNGTSLATSIPTSNSFKPANCDTWQREEIDLSAYDSEIIEIEFEAISAGGNHLYLDNIAIKGTPVPNVLPWVAIYRPTESTILTAIMPPTIPITAQATDSDGHITAVVFFVNGDSVAVDETLPYSIDYKFPDFGSYTLSVRAIDNDGGLQYSTPVDILINQETILFEEAIMVYPIPAQKQLFFTLFANENLDIHYDIYNAYAYGQLILSNDWEVEKGDNTEMINLQHLSSGTYLVNFSGKGWNVLRRFVVVD